jgi:hypothetical protein
VKSSSIIQLLINRSKVRSLYGPFYANPMRNRKMYSNKKSNVRFTPPNLKRLREKKKRRGGKSMAVMGNMVRDCLFYDYVNELHQIDILVVGDDEVNVDLVKASVRHPDSIVECFTIGSRKQVNVISHLISLAKESTDKKKPIRCLGFSDWSDAQLKKVSEELRENWGTSINRIYFTGTEGDEDALRKFMTEIVKNHKAYPIEEIYVSKKLDRKFIDIISNINSENKSPLKIIGEYYAYRHEESKRDRRESKEEYKSQEPEFNEEIEEKAGKIYKILKNTNNATRERNIKSLHSLVALNIIYRNLENAHLFLPRLPHSLEVVNRKEKGTNQEKLNDECGLAVMLAKEAGTLSSLVKQYFNIINTLNKNNCEALVLLKNSFPEIGEGDSEYNLDFPSYDSRPATISSSSSPMFFSHPSSIPIENTSSSSSTPFSHPPSIPIENTSSPSFSQSSASTYLPSSSAFYRQPLSLRSDSIPTSSSSSSFSSSSSSSSSSNSSHGSNKQYDRKRQAL